MKGLSRSSPQVQVHENAKHMFDQEIATELVLWKEIAKPSADVFSYEKEADDTYLYGCKYYKASFKNEKLQDNF